MKKLISLIVVILVITFFALSTKETSEEKIPIGVLVSLSSDFAWWGESIQNSILLFKEAGHLKDFEFIFEDTKCSAKEAVSATRNLQTLHPEMKLLIIGCDTDLKAMDSLLGNDYLAFMVGLSGADLYEINTPTINWAYRLEIEGELAGEFAMNNLGVESIGIITDNTSFGNTIANAVKKYFTSNGAEAFSETVQFNEPNPETQILKILSNNPDAIYLQGDIPGLSIILRRLDQLGYSGEKITYYGGKDPLLIESAGLSAESVYAPGAIPTTKNDLLEDFKESFSEKYRSEPFITSYFVYDGLLLLDEAVNNCDKNVKCVEDYFYRKNNFVGTLGEIRYRQGGVVDRDFQYYQVTNGKFVEIQ